MCAVDGHYQIQLSLCVKQYEFNWTYSDSHLHCGSEGGRLVRIEVEERKTMTP